MLDGRYPRPGTALGRLLASGQPVHPAGAVVRGERLRGGHRPLPDEPLRAAGGHPRPSRAREGRALPRLRPARCGAVPRPTLWFKHVLLPHVPWQFYPSGRRYRRHAPEPIPGLNGETGFGVPWLVKVSYQRHLLQLGLADRLLGELLARLRRLGLYGDALVVVVADHGIGFHVGMDRRSVTPRNAQDLAPVPLLVKLPGQRRRQSGRPARRDDRRAAHDPRAGARARAGATRRALVASARRRAGAPRDDLPPRREAAQHRGRRLQLPGRRARAALAAGRPAQARPVRKRRRPRARGALPDRAAARAAGRARDESPACARERDRGDPSGGAAAAGESCFRLRARRDHR